MSIILLLVAVVMVLLSVVIFGLKLVVAFDHCSGGAPLLDGVFFPPVFLGVGSAVLFHHFGIGMSGVAVGLVSLAVVISAYFVAWKLGARRRH